MKFLKLMTLVTLLPMGAQAVPIKFSECAKKIQLKTPKNATGVFFNDTCDTAYVLPPEAGSLKIHSLNLNDEANFCKDFNDVSDSVSSLISSLKLSTTMIERYNLQAQEILTNLEAGLLPAGMTLEEVEAKIEDLDQKAKEKQKLYLELVKELIGLKTFYANAPVAKGKFFLESNFDDLVSEYQKQNPNIFFTKIPLEQSYIMINEKAAQPGADPYNMPMDTVISIETTTAGFLPLLKQIRDPESTQVEPPKLPGGLFSASLDGNIVLSALGACPLIGKSGLPSTIDLSAVESHISASVVYQYHVQMLKKHSITFNLAQLAKRIESSSEKGGFFSRKSVHSLIETSKSDKWITFEMYSDDPTYNYTEEYRNEIKQQFLNSVLQEVAYVSFDEPGAYPSVVLPTGATGAGVVAEGLGKCPHLYCQVGMYAMKFLDTTFGKKSAISEFIRTRDVWSKETKEERHMVPYVGSYSFK